MPLDLPQQRRVAPQSASTEVLLTTTSRLASLLFSGGMCQYDVAALDNLYWPILLLYQIDACSSDFVISFLLLSHVVMLPIFNSQ